MRRLRSLRPGLLVALLNRAGAKDARIAELEAELAWHKAVLAAVQETLPPQPGLMRARLAERAARKAGEGAQK